MKVELGNFITENEERDAIHIAICPVVCGEELNPGDHVGLLSYDRGEYVVGKSENPIGIIDPFLKISPEKDTRVYLCLYPNTVTSLRHHYIHPVLDQIDIKKVNEAGRYLRYGMEIHKWNGTYEDLINNAINDTTNAYFGREGGPEWTSTDEFYQAIKIVTGRDPADYFSFRCGC